MTNFAFFFHNFIYHIIILITMLIYMTATAIHLKINFYY